MNSKSEKTNIIYSKIMHMLQKNPNAQLRRSRVYVISKLHNQ